MNIILVNLCLIFSLSKIGKSENNRKIKLDLQFDILKSYFFILKKSVKYEVNCQLLLNSARWRLLFQANDYFDFIPILLW